jgi:YgiT-type zinc finger domain-containing protein
MAASTDESTSRPGQLQSCGIQPSNQLRDLVRSLDYVVSIHVAEELDDDNLTIFDLESIILTGKSSSGNVTEKPGKSNASYPAPPSPERRPRQSSSSVPPASSSPSPVTSPDELCANCGQKGMQLRRVTWSFGRGASLLVIEDIPLWSCPRCGASYFTAQTMHEIDRIKTLRKSVAVDRPVPVATFVGRVPNPAPPQVPHTRGE